MKYKIATFLKDLITYDYILFATIFILFILLIILSILLRKKTTISISIVLFAFLLLFIAPFIGYIKMHDYLFKNFTLITSQKKLEFTKAVVVYGSVKNLSKYNFKKCIITAAAYKVSGNSIKDSILKFKPFKKTSIIESNINKNELRNFKIIIEPFIYSKDYNISIGAKCK
ncbi:MAG: hypothetical protein COB17_00400 [Sulfurimonas sp.]|nr:MAG: hypothetical protein COB17_00400 [Sulfurimonas sp.]